MKRLTGWLKAGAVLAVSLLVLTGPVGHAASETAVPATRPSEQTLHEFINRSRAANSLPRLRLIGGLTKLARRHSREMLEAGRMYHNDRLAEQLESWDWRVLGENVGVWASLRGMHRAFMDSPPHRQNILGAGFSKVGIGVVQRGNAFWATVIFYG